MAECAICTILGTALHCITEGKIGEYLYSPIRHQFIYCFCFKNNIKNLEAQLQKLETTKLGVELGVNEDKRNVRVIGPDVEAWLNKAMEVITEAKMIIGEKDNVQEGCLKGKWCPNLKLRYLLSKKALKKTQVVAEVQDDGIKYTKTSYSPLPPSMQALPPGEFLEFRSRVSSMEIAIEALKDDRVDLIGIIGMGGVGKTKMVKEIAKRAKEGNLFNEIVMVVVSQEKDLSKVQNSIAKRLGMELSTDDMEVGASKLRQRLQQNTKILLILDDIWDEFDLEEMGVPLLQNSFKSCKVLFTSRNQNLWHGVKSKKDILLGILEEEESWDLFREKAGDFAMPLMYNNLRKR